MKTIQEWIQEAYENREQQTSNPESNCQSALYYLASKCEKLYKQLVKNTVGNYAENDRYLRPYLVQYLDEELQQELEQELILETNS